jgi:PAS domain S-box-containing protein
MKTEDYLSGIIDGIQTPVLVIDRNFRIHDVNGATCRQFGLDREKAIGRYCYEIAHARSDPCYSHGISCPVKEVFKTQRPTRVIHKHHLPGGETTVEEVLASPFRDGSGRVQFVIEELKDVSELLKAREVIEQLGSELKTLRGILSICASCKRIKNDAGGWDSFEEFVRDRSEAAFSHGICPDCIDKVKV